MSSNFNNAKIINVYYNKGDRKPYDVNGKPIAYIGEEFVGSNEGSELRFFFGQDLDSATPMIITKRPDGETYLDLCEKIGTGANSYYKVVLNNWYAEVKGKLTLIFKVYNGTVTLNEGNTEILSASGQVIVSDIFNLEVGYAPLATSAVPPYDPDPEVSWYFALSQKLDKAQSITVTGALPTLTGDVYDDRYFYVEDEGVGRLYYINGSSAIEVVWGIGTLALTSNGNEDINVGTNAGKMYWDEDRGTIIAGLYDDQEAGIGDSLFFFGKATEAIAKGEVVQFVGNTGGNINFKKAVFAQISAQPDLLMGVAKHNIPSGDFGYVVSFGYVRNLNTTAYDDPILYLSTSVDGALSSTKPTTGFKGSIAAVARPSTDGNNGFLIVRPNLVKGIGDLADVTITTATSGQILSFDGSKWVNSTRLTTAESDIDALEGRMDTAENDIDSLEGRMTSAEGDIDDIEDGTTIVPKALADQNNNVINTTYLTQSSATATYIPLSQKGVANGVAPLGADNKILSVHLPGGVDDIKEFADVASFPDPGEASIIYVALDTNVIYRWSGTAYVEISSSLALGQTSSTAFPGDRGLALETLTDNIVDGSQALALKDQIIRNTLTTTIPLVVNSIASTTANLTEFQVNGTKVLEVTPSGGLNQNGTRLFHTTGTENIFVGIQSGKITGLSGDQNTGVGFDSLQGLTSGIRNTGVGRSALAALTTGNGNTSVGRLSGLTLSTGSNNTFVGSGAGFTSQLATASNSTALGYEAYTDKSNQMVFGNASVTEFKFDRNAGAVALLPQITASSANAHIFESTTTATDSIGGNFILKRTTTGAMADGFGYGIVFQLRDSDNVDNSVVRLQVARSGADNSGRLLFSTMNTGTLTEKMTILPDGKVGIGTASPVAPLHIATADATQYQRALKLGVGSTTNGSGSYIEFPASTTDGIGAMIGGGREGSGGTSFLQFSTNVGNPGILERMRITSTGNVGIGTSSPATNLEVKSIGVGTNVSLRLQNDGTATGIPNIDFYRNSADFGQIYFKPGGGVSGGFYVSAPRTDGVISFLTGGTNETNNLRMRITSTGNVGIGTSSPATLLEIASLATPVFRLNKTSGSTTGDELGRIDFFNSDTSGAGPKVDARISAIITGGSGIGANLVFFTGRSTTTPEGEEPFESMRILDTGLVGINETAPTAQLQVKSGATTRVPLIVDTVASGHTANIAEFSANGSIQSSLSRFGGFSGSSVSNRTNSNNSLISLSTTGTTISRNVADTNPALIVDLANASATGNIQVWQKAGTALSQIDNGGNGRFPVISNIASSNNSSVELTNNGVVIYRNIADSNPSLVVTQVSASSTGDILRLSKAGAIQASVATDGIANFTGTPSNAQTGDYTLVLADKGKVLRVNSATNRTVTIPKNSVVAFPIDTEIAILRYGTGTVSIAPVDGDVTLQSADGERKIKNRYGSVALKKIAENEWVLVGSLEA
jgi:hypothetical protein